MAGFQPSFTIANVGQGLIEITDTTVYPTTGNNQLSNFSSRYLIITTPDGNFLPNPVGSSSALRTTIAFPVILGTTDLIDIPTNYSWDICISVQLVLVPITTYSASTYLTRQDTPTLAYCGQAYIMIQKQFYSALAPLYTPSLVGTTPVLTQSTSNNSSKYKDILLKQCNQLRIEIDNAQTRASLGDLFGSQDALNNAQFLSQAAANNL